MHAAPPSPENSSPIVNSELQTHLVLCYTWCKGKFALTTCNHLSPLIHQNHYTYSIFCPDKIIHYPLSRKETDHCTFWYNIKLVR